ncbi:FAD-dependent oxidoreductase, partial [Aquimarina celericrescens]|nr:FAD-dependent oxidoreductase [Aquimarina celericrescens]
HVFMIGDAAGLIHPLCGNGMAMAIQSAKILSELLINNYDSTSLHRTYIEKEYSLKWKNTFYKRLYAGRVLQKIVLNENLQYISYLVANAIPGIVPQIIKQTHGEP